MNILSILYLFSLICFGLKAKNTETSFHNDYPEIFELKEANFDIFLNENSNQTNVLMFYSWWCPHCKKIIPILQELALNISSENIKFAIIEW